MRSQKQSNRAPRPFKNQSSSGRWSGGQGDHFIPASHRPTPKVKPTPTPPEAPKNPPATEA